MLASRLLGHFLQETVEGSNNPVYMSVEIAATVHFGGVAEGQIPKRLRELVWLRHLGTIHQNRHYRDTALQRGLDLKANEVGFFLDPLLSSSAEPAWPDDGEEDITAFECLLDVPTEIDAKRDAVHIHEHAVGPELCAQPVEDAT
ncbi:hypothetical protein AA309_27410 [Microvirga vignae]|uniref:Uncharacterized protein n=1 Tax=Microvirga vignae TaxID=1225564 RepID=A0A0H1R4K0_9HYPH|nr:hypothetical protein AA309_27410 [Microvirga vignae]